MIFEGKTTDDGELEWEELIDSVEEVDGAYMDIGWHDDDTKHPDSEYTVAQIAAVHEFGSSIRFGRSGGQRIIVPERSMLRSTSDEQWSKWADRSEEALDRIAEGVPVLKALTAVGELCASDVKRKITTLREPPLAPATIAKKGSSNPLIDTGFMRAEVHSRIVAGFSEARTKKGAA